MKDIIIIGCCGCASEIVFLLEENNKIEKEWNILGFVGEGENNLPYPILGDDEWLLARRERIFAVCAVGEPQLKKKIISKYKNAGNIDFPAIISRQALVGDRNRLGQGTVICSGATITTDVVLGEFVTINIGATICHQTHIQDYTTIAPGVNVSGNVKIGKEAYLGVGTKVIQGISIGDRAVIGAGGVVIENIPQNVTAVGCPTRIIRGSL